MERGGGADIDRHDVVVRFNNYVLEGFEQDYGTRTDVWLRGFGFAQVQDWTEQEDYLYSGISGDRYLLRRETEQVRLPIWKVFNPRLNRARSFWSKGVINACFCR